MAPRSAPPHGSLLLVAFMVLVGSRAAAAIYVDASATGANDGTSWPDAYSDLQSALATGPGEFWVAAGTYTPAAPGGSRLASFSIQSGQSLYGGFAGTETSRGQRNPALHLTTLSGDLNGDDSGGGSTAENSYHVLFFSSTDNSPVIDGFTIAHGSASRSSGAASQGGGVYSQNSSPSFVDCRFVSNFAHLGAGILVLGGSVTFDRCEFSGNQVTNGRGGGIFNTGTITITDCLFEGNTVGGSSVSNGGGAIFDDFGASATVHRTRFTSNSASSTSTSSGATGGGISHSGAFLDVVDCTFSGQASNLGGAVYTTTDAYFENCEFSGNDAFSGPGGLDTGGIGGAVLNASGGATSVTVVGCVVTGNTANDGAGLAGGFGTLTTVVNSIVWNNVDATGPSRQAQLKGPGGYAVSYSCVQELFTAGPGEDPIDPANFPGSIVSDPMLLGNLQLGPGSPCIDAGDNTAVGTTTDLLGNARFFDDPDTTDAGNGTAPIVDMGPYEFSGGPGPDPCLPDSIPPTITCPASVPVAFADTNCQAAVPDFQADAVLSDNCTAVGDLVFQQNPAAGTLLGQGTHSITLSVTDGAGLTDFCIVLWRVRDHAFIRGNINTRSAHTLDMGDVVDLVATLFGGFNPGFDCAAAIDVNDDGGWNLLDVVALIQGLFGSDGYAIPPPLLSPGVATVDGGSVPSVLGCNQGEACP